MFMSMTWYGRGGRGAKKMPIVLIMAGTASITKRDIYHVLNTWENTHVCDYT